MPKGVGYGGDEVSSTTNKKVITKKAVPQKKYSTADPPIHPQTPAPTGIPSRPKGNSPEAIAEFQRQVAASGADEATQRDILRAAKVPLSGTGISSTPPAETRKGLGMRPDEMTKPTAKKDGVGIRDKQKTDSVDRALQQKVKRAGELQRAGPAGKETRRKEDAMKAGGFAPAEINAFKSMEEERLLRKRKKEPVFETEQPGP
jgi:hypothetical protein